MVMAILQMRRDVSWITCGDLEKLPDLCKLHELNEFEELCELCFLLTRITLLHILLLFIRTKKCKVTKKYPNPDHHNYLHFPKR